MSPTSYPCSTPRYFVHSLECLYIITRSFAFVKRFLKYFFFFTLNPLTERICGYDFFFVYALIYVGNGGNIHEFFKIRIKNFVLLFLCSNIPLLM